MTCWMMFLERVKKMLKVSDDEAREILQDIENEVGHNLNLIKAVIDFEKEGLVKRLKKKKKHQGKEVSISYA